VNPECKLWNLFVSLLVDSLNFWQLHVDDGKDHMAGIFTPTAWSNDCLPEAGLGGPDQQSHYIRLYQSTRLGANSSWKLVPVRPRSVAGLLQELQ
jgi:hypothetical protein